MHLVQQEVFQEHGQFSGQSQPGQEAIWPGVCLVSQPIRNVSNSCG